MLLDAMSSLAAPWLEYCAVFMDIDFCGKLKLAGTDALGDAFKAVDL